MESQELLKVLIKSVDDVKEKLDKLDDRFRHVEKAIAESSGRHSGLVTAKDIFVVLGGRCVDTLVCAADTRVGNAYPILTIFAVVSFSRLLVTLYPLFTSSQWSVSSFISSNASDESGQE